VELPVVKTAIAALPIDRPVIGYEGPRKKVLIVDDVPQNRAMLMDALEPLGFEVHDAKNGGECLELLDSVKPDLIVMDVMMPVMDGREAARRIRANPKFAETPVILVTASAGPEDEAKCYAAGASAFLAKPIELHILLKTIGHQLSLQWISEEPQREALEEAEETTEDFVIPPQEEMEKLHRLAQVGNMQSLIEWADSLRSQDPRYASFAGKLKSLAERYQSKAISLLVERGRAGRAGERSENPS
jgi:CheY-like chemotaxis protein